MRTNAAERNLTLASAEGELLLNVSQHWQIQDISVSFTAKLVSGTPSEDDLSYIHERRHLCPVSSNLPDRVDLQNSVVFTQSLWGRDRYNP